LTEVEDIYRPYKQKKKTRATMAVAKGLQPLADIIFAQDDSVKDINALAKEYISEEKGVKTAKEAIDGAKDIIAELISDKADL
ncbi:MAG: Tex-like N-terminal domain-containing protein, partial [Clostridia bacterium]